MRGFIFLLSAIALSGCSCDFFDSPEIDAGPMDGGVGAPCMADRHCRAGLVCDGVACGPAGDGIVGQVCQLTGDCGEGLYCNARRVCGEAGDAMVGEACEGTGDCVPGLLCAFEGFGFSCVEAGAGDIGGECASDLDCLAGLACVDVGGTRSCQAPPAFESDAGAGGGLPPVIPRWSGVECEEDDGPPVAYFRVPRGDASDGDFYRLPFPNDVRRAETGGLDLSGHPSPSTALSVDVLGRHIAAAEQDLDGFATNPVIYFRFSRPYDGATVNGDRFWFVDITPGSPEYGRNFGRGWLTTGGRITRYICPNWLAMRMGHGAPLRPGTTYAAVLMDGIRGGSTGDDEISVDADLAAVLGAARPDADDALGRAWDAYQPLRDWLAEDGTPSRLSVLNAAVFTTQSATARPTGIRRAVRAAAAPTLSNVTVCGDGVESPCAERACGASSDAFHEVHALISLPQFQQGTPPFEHPDDGGGISVDGGGTPVVQRSEDVCAVFAIPKGVADPTDGFPVVIYAHGTNGAATGPIENGVAEAFAPDAITVAIDMPLHGSRRNGSERPSSELVFNFANPRSARDTFLQGAADLMSVVRFLEEGTIAAADAPTSFDVRFDAARVALFGHSQGGTHAQLVLGAEPGLAAVVLSGAGGDLTESLLTKTQPVNVAQLLPLALLDREGDGSLPVGDYHPALALFQMFYERVDPVNYARYVHREPAASGVRHVFMTYGMGDSFSTERTMGAYARAAGMTHVGPIFSDVGLGDPVPPPVSGNVTVMDAPYTVGLRQYEPDDGDDGHFVALRTTQGRGDAVRFVLQALEAPSPSIGE